LRGIGASACLLLRSGSRLLIALWRRLRRRRTTAARGS
jgi:hypothetical protein